MNKSLLVFVCLIAFHNALAQKVTDLYLKEHLLKTSYSLDLEANAIVLREVTTADVSLQNQYDEVIHYYKLIKILKPSGVSLADVAIDNEHIRNIEAATYNFENGEVVKNKLPGSAIYEYKSKGRRHLKKMKFTLPNVKVGSIIEYSYSIVMPLRLMLPPWTIQDDYPKLYSRYELNTAKSLSYMYAFQSDEPFKEYTDIKKAEAGSSNAYTVKSDVLTDQQSAIWVKKNIPALHTQPFVNSIENYRQRVDFQLMGTATRHLLFLTWKDLNKALLDNRYFGWSLDRINRFLNHIVDSLINNEPEQLQQAKNIYHYIRDNYDCSDDDGIGIENDISKIYKDRRGSSAEINLLLTAMLRHAGIDAYPVILSKRGNIKIEREFPLLNRFNYTICAVAIDSQQYLLDASDNFNSFGILPNYCYNGYARLINEHEGKELDLFVPPMKEKDVVITSIDSITNNKICISIVEKIGRILSRELRDKWFSDSVAEKKYLAAQVQGLSEHAVMSNLSVENFNDPDTNLVIKYQVTMPGGNDSILYVSSQMVKLFQENPFKDNNRYLPIELPYKMDWLYILSCQLPNGIDLEDMPQSSAINLNSNEMNYKNIITYDSAARMLMIRTSYLANRTFYPESDYTDIKRFFEKVIQDGNGMLTLKKKRS
ncbi:MAG: DUF3857 and transglutaminase domain-containing protein [Flavipsychrobacter sp.]